MCDDQNINGRTAHEGYILVQPSEVSAERRQGVKPPLRTDRGYPYRVCDRVTGELVPYPAEPTGVGLTRGVVWSF